MKTVDIKSSLKVKKKEKRERELRKSQYNLLQSMV